MILTAATAAILAARGAYQSALGAGGIAGSIEKLFNGGAAEPGADPSQGLFVDGIVGTYGLTQ